MAPLTTVAGPGAPAGFTSINQQAPNNTDVIEIDDSDDEPMEEAEDIETNDDEGDMEDEEDEEEEDEEDEEEEEDDYGDEEDSPDNDSAEDSNRSESPLDLSPPPTEQNGLAAAATPDLFTSAGAQEALHPLRRTADRVTRQIEAFAEKLDRFKQQGNRSGELEDYKAAYQLVRSYQELARGTIQDIQKDHTLKRAKLGFGANRANGPMDAKAQEEVQRLQLEESTWQLFCNLITIANPHRIAKSEERQATAFQNLHRYSTDREVWEQFLDSDAYAVECVVILKWLEYTAKNSSQDIDDLISELETQAQRGQGSWSFGWLYTKETIKGHKRLRAWPQPLEPNDPGITASLLKSEDAEPLVTQLDPDAITRQKQNLQKQDQYYERATWMTLWKMLRQGESWSKIREWSAERLEPWRAVSICGSSVDVETHKGRTPVDDGHTRLMNWRSQETWSAACIALARNPKIEDYERAVFSLLCGETEAAFKICQSWDDFLYVYFNRAVLSRYQGFCKQLQRKLSHSPTAQVPYVAEPAGHDEVKKFIEFTRDHDRVGFEARNPYRTIQAAILSRGYDKFFLSLAHAVSQVANNPSDGSSLVPEMLHMSVQDSLLITATDRDALRIATHLLIVTRRLGMVRSDTTFFDHTSVNIIGYIANLEDAGLVDLIPLYDSLLPTHYKRIILARVMIEVVDPRERKLLVQLMEKHGLDVEEILETQWEYISHRTSAIDHSRTMKFTSKVVTRKDGDRELAIPRHDLIGTEISDVDERVIRSLEWLRFVDGQWGKICQLGSQVYQRYYRTGNLAAARELSRRMNLSDISRESFGFDLAIILKRAMYPERDFSASEPSSPIKSILFTSPHKRSRSKTNGNPVAGDTGLLLQQSQTMRDLETLIMAFDGLEKFSLALENFETARQNRDSGTIKDLREKVQAALAEASDPVDWMLRDWLVGAETESEQAELEEIRNMYIPEVFLNYHNALFFSARVLNSEILVQCMNLAIQVSENRLLTQTFVASRRMQELVVALALSSKAMVNTRAKPGVKVPGGESLGLWNVETVEGEELDDGMAQ
ncbi:nucleoporin Nup84/Nup107 family protein [Aspergillus fijiensis CBS 313.89]|uniref:Nuclear pore complex protein n=1 Tax=Aspergillus fijiensis CBS 313.89 TaxID=1448319 RepID=A0A8G1RSW2_9EURO|nr:nuclear pore complex protein [Aspergillus fijiensis CBS 313.89]RAK78269.1 nuclear pore complex protein [Aspergillus fijiensis CBS 313.89]